MNEMSLSDKLWHSTWKPASGHTGGWRVCRQFFAPLKPATGYPNFQEATGESGKLRLFKNFESAKMAADKLNEMESSG